jgi:sulfate transport system substrate-binding protein
MPTPSAACARLTARAHPTAPATPARLAALFALLTLLAALALLAPARLDASGCCAGYGNFGLDARWNGATTGQPEEERTVTVSHAATTTTRALYAEINKTFGDAWVKKTRYTLALNAAHGPAFAHTRAIAAGQSEADIVTLDNPAAIDALADAGLLPTGWRARLPHHSGPVTTTLVFLVRKGNPKAIRDWADLSRPGLRAALPDPRDSSVGQWIWLAAWTLALERAHGDPDQARADVHALYRNAPAIYPSANAATGAFIRRKSLDLLPILENEARARLAVGELPADDIEIVTPPASLRVETPVAWLDANVQKHENARVSASLLMYLFTPPAQEIAARHFLRPTDPATAQKTAAAFPPLRLLTLDDTLGGWPAARARLLGPGSELDRARQTLLAAPPPAAPPKS